MSAEDTGRLNVKRDEDQRQEERRWSGKVARTYIAKLTLKENSKSKIIYPVDIADAETVDNTYSEMCGALLHLAISWRTLVCILLFIMLYPLKRGY